jgi:UDP-N-acetylglucosamine--N-acetylmuramyl-(pentapeptide) pyrophosphoryl-undecaprenol N-acetylglucosamine transferase
MNNGKKVIALTWWWTWWHVFPLLSLYTYLKEENKYTFIWVWEDESLEEEIAIKNKINFLDIPAWKIRRYFDFRNFYEPFKNLTWIVFWIYYILKYKIDIIFSKWWYVALPLCIAWFLLRKKIYIHESDMVWWITNKCIEKIASKVFYTFPNEKTLKNNKKYIFSGQILNPELLDGLTNLTVEQNELLKVIVIWGSQGSTIIFKELLKIIPNFENIDFQVILWDKNLHFREEFSKFENVKVYDFVSQKKLWVILKQTDIAITRWWATTLTELTLFWIHSIIIPLASSAGNHQELNAKYFREKFWSDIILEGDIEKNLSKKLNLYRDLRKSWLNLEGFFAPLKIIEKEIS